MPAPARQAALARCVVEIEEHVAQRGWDAAVGVFALVRTAGALAADPRLAELLDRSARERAAVDPESLTAIEQEELPASTDLDDLLGQLAWPHTVDGVALSVEHIIVPPAAEKEAVSIADAQERLAFLTSHPGRDEVRMVVGVLRGGPSWCALRTRSHDTPGQVVQGPDVVPGLVEALRATLA